MQTTAGRNRDRTIRLRDDYAQLKIILVGCGGNGSHMAEAIARVGKLLIKQGRDIDIVFIDPDHVEPDNIPRQNFSEAEIGLNKAQLLALRYSAKWGITIRAMPAHFEKQNFYTYNSLTFFIGCVDNAPARAAINRALLAHHEHIPRVWWLDLGNGLSTGQVVLGSASSVSDLETAFRLHNVCTATPSPGLLHPELLEDSPKQAKQQPVPADEMSQGCAQLALTNEQMPAVNQMTAAIGAAMLTKLLITRDLKYWASYFDLNTGKQVSHGADPQVIEDLLVNVKTT